MPFLRGTTPIWGTRDLPGRFKEWKACLVEIGQTAHKLETNVTSYEKRDRSGYFIDSLFLVWIVSAKSVVSNGASFVKKEAS